MDELQPNIMNIPAYEVDNLNRFPLVNGYYDVYAEVRALGGTVISAGVYFTSPVAAALDRPRVAFDVWVNLDSEEKPRRYGYKVAYNKEYLPVHFLVKIGEMNFSFRWEGYPPTTYIYDSPLALQITKEKGL